MFMTGVLCTVCGAQVYLICSTGQRPVELVRYLIYVQIERVGCILESSP